MALSTANPSKNMPASFLRHTLSNDTPEWRFRVHVNVTLNIQTEQEKVFVSTEVVTYSGM